MEVDLIAAFGRLIRFQRIDSSQVFGRGRRRQRTRRRRQKSGAGYQRRRYGQSGAGWRRRQRGTRVDRIWRRDARRNARWSRRRGAETMMRIGEKGQ